MFGGGNRDNVEKSDGKPVSTILYNVVCEQGLLCDQRQGLQSRLFLEFIRYGYKG